MLSAYPTSMLGSLDEDFPTSSVRCLTHLLNIIELQDEHLLEMLLPLAISSMWSLNPFPLHTQGCAWILHALQQSPGNSAFYWLNQTLQPYLLPTPLGADLSSTAEIAHPRAQHARLSHSEEKHFGTSVTSPSSWQGERNLHLLLCPICYTLTGNQLGNHRENMAVQGRGGWREALSLLGIKSADISPRLIQTSGTAALHHFLLIFSEKSSKIPRSFSLSPG